MTSAGYCTCFSSSAASLALDSLGLETALEKATSNTSLYVDAKCTWGTQSSEHKVCTAHLRAQTVQMLEKTVCMCPKP